MLSYRHAFHAGNHADVLKHLVLVRCLDYLKQKDKPFWAVDTHAGAGVYALDKGFAAQNAEYASGIARLWSRRDLPPPLAAYVEQVAACNHGRELRQYPGSPWLIRALLRPDDRLRLFELHNSDLRLLHKAFEAAGKQVLIEDGDGFQGLLKLLPPPPRRALVLIDPPYEMKTDYAQVETVLRDSLRRFPGGTYAIWYPQLQTGASRRLPETLKAVGAPSWLNVSLSVVTPAVDGFGMHGSGMFVVNPPWTLPAELATVMPYLVEVLGQDAGAGFHLESRIP